MAIITRSGQQNQVILGSNGRPARGISPIISSGGGGGESEPFYQAGPDLLIANPAFDSSPGAPYSTAGTITTVADFNNNGWGWQLAYTPSSYTPVVGWTWVNDEGILTDVCVSVDFAVDSGYYPSEGDGTLSGFKFLILWRNFDGTPREDEGRLEYGLGNLVFGSGIANSGWVVGDNSSDVMFNGGVTGAVAAGRATPQGLYQSIADGNPHRFTARVNTTIGYHKAWIDGTQYINDEGHFTDISPNGLWAVYLGSDKVAAPTSDHWVRYGTPRIWSINGA